MRVCFVNEFFYPDDHGGTGTVLTSLAQSLRETHDDVEIDVITSRNRYRSTGGKLEAYEEWNGIRIHRVPAPSSNGLSAFRRLCVGFLFSVMSLISLLGQERYDVILVGTAPPMVAMAVQLFKFITGTPYVYVLYDLEPDRAITLGLMSAKHPLAWMLRTCQKSWLHSSDMTVVLGRCMAKHVEQSYGLSHRRIQVIQNGADPEAISPMSKHTQFRDAHGLNGFIVCYSGNFGRYHNFDAILDAARQLNGLNPDIHFVLVGDGAQKSHISDRVRNEQISNVHMFSYVPSADYADLLASADVSLVTLEKGMEGLCVPSKFYSILASGRPTIAMASAKSEVALEIADTGCGIQIDQADTSRLVAVLTSLYDNSHEGERMGMSARNALTQKYTHDILARKYYSILKMVAGDRLSVTTKEALTEGYRSEPSVSVRRLNCEQGNEFSSPGDLEISDLQLVGSASANHSFNCETQNIKSRNRNEFNTGPQSNSQQLTQSYGKKGTHNMANSTISSGFRTNTVPEHNKGKSSWMSKIVDNNIVAVILLMVVLVPLITGTAILNGQGKLLAFELLGTVLMALALSKVRTSGALARIKKTVLAGPNLPITLLVAFAAVSYAFSPFHAYSFTEFVRIGFCSLMYFVIVYHVRDNAKLQALTDGLMLVTLLVSLIGLAQMSIESGAVNGVGGSFGSHELLGSFLMLMLPLAVTLGLVGQGQPKRQLATQVVALLAAACLLVVRTRSAWVGEAAALAALMLIGFRYRSTTRPLTQQKHLVVGPLLILIGAVSLFVMLSQTGPILGQRIGTFAHVGQDDSFVQRLSMWHGAEKMIAQKPLFGWGIGTYPVRESAFSGIGESAHTVLTQGADHNNLAHNFYLQTAAEIGVLGLLVYLSAILMFFVIGLRSLGKMEPGLKKSLLIGCLAAMAGQVIDAIASPAYNFASVSLFQWVLMGVGMSAAGLGGRAPSESRQFADAPAATGVPVMLVRGVRFSMVAASAVFMVGQVIPTSTAALAQNCGSNNTTRAIEDVAVVGAVGVLAAPTINAAIAAGHGLEISGIGADSTLGAGDSYTLTPKFHGKLITDGTFSTEGDTDLVKTEVTPDGNLIVTRSGVPGTGKVTVNLKFTDSNGVVQQTSHEIDVH